MTAGLSVSCPNCNTVLVASGAAAMGKCKACGTVFPLYAAAPPAPPRSTKVCCQCGVDVAHVKRWKDSTGHYYCNPCWDARRAAVAAAMAGQSAGASTSARPKAPVDEWAACGGVFALQDLCDTGGGQILCTACYQQLRSDAEPAPAGYTCAACQQVFDAEQVVDAGDGRVVCQACYAGSAAAVQCCGCGGSFPPAEVYDDNGQPLCHGCYAQRAAGGGEVYEGFADQGGFESEQPATRECPYCAETINARAIKCRFCGEILDGHSLRGPARTISPVGPAAPQTPPDRFSQFNP